MPLPFHLNILPTLDSRPSSGRMSDGMDIDSEESQFSSPISKSGGDAGPLSVVRRLEDPFQFERDHSRERKPGGRSESLIAMRLKDLAFLGKGRDGGEEG
jgi:hypothetical protein